MVGRVILISLQGEVDFRFPSLDSYLDRLRGEGLSLMILKDGEAIFMSSEEGMRPLFEAINRLGLHKLEGSLVVDKIVGKAAALLVSYFKAGEVRCAVMSAKAKEVLDKRGIEYHAEKVTPEIMNKLGTDICPFEKAVLDVEDPQEGYERLYAKLKTMNITV